MDEQIVTAKTHLKNLTLKHKQAAEHLKKLEVDIEALSKKMTSLDNKRNRTENQKNQARQDTKQYTNQLKNAFNNLSVTYQVYVSPYLPDNDLEWLDTTYPTEIDLEQLNQEVSSRKVHAKSLKKLHQQFNAWNNLDRERQNYRKDLTELEKKNSLAEAPQVRSEKHNLQQIQEKQKLQLQERKQEHSLAKTKLTKASKTVTKLSSDLQQCQVKLRENQGSQKEIQRDLKSRIGSLHSVENIKSIIINNRALPNFTLGIVRKEGYIAVITGMKCNVLGF
ncbi:MAG: hypothetical protein F6J89_18775 [Symploca sp. SIO1C4]|uniref:Uncharacterized protein n=1 Tax=Symploca sp. SIO1C4 TaxID=2607765 RepID=A0A6B3NF88_9CYAN|nr:hypothetical protein [Symploca sp. SIO1C4]